jgi:hypothetical protein
MGEKNKNKNKNYSGMNWRKDYCFSAPCIATAEGRGSTWLFCNSALSAAAKNKLSSTTRPPSEPKH